MSDYTYTIVHDPLTRTQYTLRYFAERNTVRLVQYYEMHRDTPRNIQLFRELSAIAQNYSINVGL